MGGSKVGGITMLNVIIDNFEVGYVTQFVNKYGKTYFQGIYPTPTGKICSKVFQDESDAQDWVKMKYAETGYVPFYQHLQQAVTISGLSHNVIALEINSSRSSITKWLAGEQYPAVHFLLRLSRVLFPKKKANDKYLEWSDMIEKERK